MTETDKRARIAGAIYLVTAIPAFFSLMYVPKALYVPHDMAATIARVGAHASLFRWGLAAELAGYASWVFVPLALNWLFESVDRGLARLMVILGLMTTPIIFVTSCFGLAAVSVLEDARFAAAFPPQQLQALAALLLRLHDDGFTAAAVFWGLWLFPFAALVWRCGFLPRFLAVLLTIGGVGWLVSSFTDVLAPGLVASIGPIARAATGVGELPIIFWLLVVGAKAGRGREASPQPEASTRIA